MIVCCREDEASSLLVSDLRDYKRSTYPQREKTEIIDYLRKHFTEDPAIFCQGGACVGANADPQRYLFLCKHKCLFVIHSKMSSNLMMLTCFLN